MSDADLAAIAAQKDVELVEVVRTPIDARLCQCLGSLPRLNTLGLFEGRITSLAGLERAKLLDDLRIEFCSLRCNQFAPLGKLTELRQIIFQQVPVTDCDLVPFTKLKQLETLILDETEITNCGLPTLARMTWLDDLWVTDTRVTEQGCEWLQQRLPRTFVLR